MLRLLKLVFCFALVGGLVIALVVAGVNLWIVHETRDGIHSAAADIQTGPIGVVLGNQPGNPFFEARMDAAAALYKSGKVRYLIVSGANPTKYYNEPDAMKKALIKRGVPTTQITCDYAGLRTLDTVVRAKEIFGAKTAVFISQDFHLYRTLYLARAYGLKAEGYPAADPERARLLPVILREWAARCLAFLDVHVFERQPHILGEKEPLDLR